MITQENIKDLLLCLGFEKSENSANDVMTCHFANINADISVDFTNQQIIYPAGVEMEAIRTKCEVVFPNGRKEMLHGSTTKSLDDVSILVGMDMLSNCKIHFEPYNYGFKYKIIFI